MIDCDQYGKVKYTTGGEWKLYKEQPAFDFLHDYLDPNRLVGLSRGVAIDGIQYGPIEAVLDRQ